MSQASKYFITRLNVGREYMEIKENTLNSNQDNSTAISNQIVNLYKQQSKRIACGLRLRTRIKKEKSYSFCLIYLDFQTKV